jgi:hypothetical protein
MTPWCRTRAPACKSTPSIARTPIHLRGRIAFLVPPTTAQASADCNDNQRQKGRRRLFVAVVLRGSEQASRSALH